MASSNPANISAEAIASLPPNLQAQIPYYNDSLQPNLYAAATVCFVAVCVTIGLRLYARRLKGQKLGWDDHLILIALGFYVPFYACNIMYIHWGVGRHEVVFALEQPENYTPARKIALANKCLALVPLYFTKLSTVCLYNRIFGGASNTARRMCIALGIFLTVLHIYSLTLYLNSCIPIAMFWSSVKGGHCFHFKVPFLVTGSVYVVSDAIVLLFPMPYIWRMRTSTRLKWQLTGIFLLGWFVLAISILQSILFGTQQFPATDAPWMNFLPTVMSSIQSCTGGIAACLPVLRPVFNKCIYGTIDAPTTCRANSAVFSGNPVSDMDLWMQTVGGRKILASGNGTSAGWTETTIEGPGGSRARDSSTLDV